MGRSGDSLEGETFAVKPGEFLALKRKKKNRTEKKRGKEPDIEACPVNPSPEKAEGGGLWVQLSS